MKRLLLTICFLLMIPSMLFAASSATTTVLEKPGGVFLFTVSWTAHTDGTFTDYTIPDGIDGYVMLVQDDPGSTAPTANYDIDLISTTSNGSITGCTTAIATCTDGSMINRSATISGQGMSLISSTPVPRYVAGQLKLQIANNSVNSATGTVYITVQRVQ